MEKRYDLETPDGMVRISGMYEQQVRSLRSIFPEIKVVSTVVDVDFGRTAQRNREEAAEAARWAARMAGQALPREEVDDE